MGVEIFGVEDIMQIQQEKIKKAIQEYIRQQLQEDLNYEQLTMREVIDPFAGEQEKGNYGGAGKRKQIKEAP